LQAFWGKLIGEGDIFRPNRNGREEKQNKEQDNATQGAKQEFDHNEIPS